MARPLRLTTVGVLCAAGAAGASASVFGKLASQQQDWPAQALCYALLLAVGRQLGLAHCRAQRQACTRRAAAAATAAAYCRPSYGTGSQ